ncbi:vacuolar protein sorting-associated protein VTA1, putative [Plasmodium berghei]|uniref:Vacuolar protein sorting-associated protein VTA1, putative n=2 Tax=Plasmodium berghei TaxID=5821 RepID=A0A509AJN0_PLABA|nr:vacuolar protein sorting-associated protein VTA1, putative [Plasmodium berghei ANKA]CXH88860.1 vacuolar protein sorting-associated protein VTA1, putative [Plasmodium berghei]SCL90250.1 vacuolar protein sorting-associated protein VTA1, putative [Plasmodium berghei]SCM15252.1 vacuolar protein sorting-associated protein VTA1, putative [Plasmodium berghei]SCM17047.1 vacuolar protein sorting-associated protein VTA1, putative [Plasmodium berghei]SCN21924.1 vacuolar protein sorting-associated prot|eukprot:XP_034419827.1 vacuolar protein sorting-associated protein VTA1, putative [Plasmodium berghei ANKA]
MEENMEKNKKGEKPNMKQIKFILKKSEELEKKHSLVSFLCVLYVSEKLNDYVKNNYSDIEAKDLLLNCVKKAEEIRPSFDLIDYSKLADLCKQLFLAADKNDRTDEITNKTIHMFFTAQIFYEILNHFQALNNDEKKKYLYAKYKTIYIKKCFDNNIKPEPGSPKAELEQDTSEKLYEEMPINQENKKEDIEKEKSDEENKWVKDDILWGAEENYLFSKNEDSNLLSNNTDNNKIGENNKNGKYVDISQSLKHSQYATNALMFEDVVTAKKELKIALSYLE